MGKGLVLLKNPSGDTAYYILHEEINSNDILSILANSKYPNQLIKDMGTKVDDAEFAEMEQSKECMFSIDYAIGDNSAILYEINGGRGGISEKERTENNISFNRVNISNYKVLSEKKLIKKAKDLINEYSLNEFKNEADFSDLKQVDLAYTEWHDDETGIEYQIQSSVDLENYCLNTWVNGDLMESNQYSSLKELISNELTYLSFDSLVSLSKEVLEKLHEQEINQQADKAIDEHEAEYGADGRCVFPHLNDEPKSILGEIPTISELLDKKNTYQALFNSSSKENKEILKNMIAEIDKALTILYDTQEQLHTNPKFDVENELQNTSIMDSINYLKNAEMTIEIAETVEYENKIYDKDDDYEY